MDKEKLKTALLKIAKKLNRNNIDWVLIGTATHKLQGMKKSPNDIDIIIKLKSLEKAREIFADYSPSEIKKIRPGDFKIDLKIESIPVEIIGEKCAVKYFENEKKFIGEKKLEQTKIPCRKLKWEIKLYRKLDRPEEAQEIKNFLENK